MNFSGISTSCRQESDGMLQKKTSLRKDGNDTNAPAISSDGESVQPPPAAEIEEPSLTMERGGNNDISIFFSPNAHGKPTKIIFKGICEKGLLRTFIVADLITTIVLENITRPEPYGFMPSEFPYLKHIVFSGGSCRAQMPKTVSKVSYLGNYEIEKNLSLPAHIREVAIGAEVACTLRSFSCGNLAQITINGNDIVADGVIQFGPEFCGLKAIDLSGSLCRGVTINGLPSIEHLFLSNSAISSLKIGSESSGRLRNISIIGCAHLHLNATDVSFSNSSRLIITYDNRTAGRDLFDSGNGTYAACHFIKIDDSN
ncbi:MAG: hypothetical protein LBI34_02915 [Puniceicoccales bacterium]|jgi:hypothetical protein|nr:hypothetical protein [Puniceicoccales bacterium]